jgi:hypothetical protein
MNATGTHLHTLTEIITATLAGTNNTLIITNVRYESVLLNTAWCVLRLRVEGSPPDTEGSCEYIE